MLHRMTHKMKRSAYEFEAEGLVQEVGYSLPHKLTVTENPPTQSLSVWVGKWGQRTENVLEPDQTAGTIYHEPERFVTDRKRAGACLQSPAVSP